MIDFWCCSRVVLATFSPVVLVVVVANVAALKLLFLFVTRFFGFGCHASCRISDGSFFLAI